MRYIFAARNHRVLEKFTSGAVLLAFDFDGTIAPITSRPGGAVIPGRTRKLLQRLAASEVCIVVSGRRRSDALKRVRGIPFKDVIGNHGVEPHNSSPAVARIVKTWMPLLRPKLRSFQGVIVESKRFSVSVHYRQARDKKRTLRAIMQAVGTLTNARVLDGKQVVNVVVRGAPDKGVAVEKERRMRHCERVIYLGDDDTDECAFALARQGRLLGIRVGEKRSSLADFYIRDQREMDRLLRSLLALRLAERERAVRR